MDLAVAMAVVSSLNDLPVPPDLVIVGEIGLTGEVRPVGHMERRLQESRDLGFKRCVLPAANYRDLDLGAWGMKLHPVRHVKEALQAVFSD